LQRALAKRTSAVKAGVVDGVKLTAYVGDGDRDSLQWYFTNLTWGDIRCLQCAHKCHGRSF
jgi:hypothetical protein